MELDELREYCLSKKGATEEMPFGPDTLVYKVMGKMFALCGIDDEPLTVNLKCDPERAMDMREQYPDDVLPGYHMNKTHWNTVLTQGRLSRHELEGMIDHSYTLVVKSLKKAEQAQLASLNEV